MSTGGGDRLRRPSPPANPSPGGTPPPPPLVEPACAAGSLGWVPWANQGKETQSDAHTSRRRISSVGRWWTTEKRQKSTHTKPTRARTATRGPQQRFHQQQFRRRRPRAYQEQRQTMTDDGTQARTHARTQQRTQQRTHATTHARNNTRNNTRTQQRTHPQTPYLQFREPVAELQAGLGLESLRLLRLRALQV